MIDCETLLNDKKLLREEIEELKAHIQAQKILIECMYDELVNCYDEIGTLKEVTECI